MIDEILPRLYRIEIPLPHNPLKSLNSYLIKGGEQFLVIDTGMNREECYSVMLAALSDLHVDLSKTDYFITHIHADHLGLIARLATDKSKIYFNQVEAAMVNNNAGVEDNLEKISRYFLSHSFPADELKRSVENHPGRRFGPKQIITFHILKEGDKLDIGDYSFQYIETPGHSPGHICLYEPNKKILISGDHILSDITPNIAYWAEMDNPLKQYLTSLDKVYPLDVNLTLPGHRSLINNHKKRVLELKEHHHDRIREIISTLENGAKTAYQVAPQITWDIDCKSWDEFPAQQKWFAFGETLAHLIYMRQEGMISEKREGNMLTFSIT